MYILRTHISFIVLFSLVNAIMPYDVCICMSLANKILIFFYSVSHLHSVFILLCYLCFSSRNKIHLNRCVFCHKCSTICLHGFCNICTYFLTYQFIHILGSKKNRLNETVLLSTTIYVLVEIQRTTSQDHDQSFV